MGKLRALSGKEVCAILSRYGFVEVRRRGSHIVMQQKSSEGTVTVPI
ncbi:MAG: type II toxin-antitoxin system HicA family toxin [Chloroflexaceae bacterium]